MKRLIALIILLTLIACDEGVLITVPASSSVSFTMAANIVNSDPDNVQSASSQIDVAGFVNEDSEQIESIKLDKLTYELSRYNDTSGDIVLVDLSIATRLNGTTTPILVISGLVVENTGIVLAFEDGNPESVLSAAQVASLESIMDNLTPFEMIVTGDFTDHIDSDFQVSMNWEVTVSVSQPSDDGG